MDDSDRGDSPCPPYEAGEGTALGSIYAALWHTPTLDPFDRAQDEQTGKHGPRGALPNGEQVGTNADCGMMRRARRRALTRREWVPRGTRSSGNAECGAQEERTEQERRISRILRFSAEGEVSKRARTERERRR